MQTEAARLDGGGVPSDYGLRQFLFQDLIPSVIDYTTARNPQPSGLIQEQEAFRVADQRGTAEDNSSQFLFGNIGGKEIGLSTGGLALAAFGLYFIWKSKGS